MSCTLRGALLAGGESRRLGRDKALVSLGGETLVERAAKALTAVVEEAAIFGGKVDAYALPSLESVADELPGRGPLGGIHAALGRWPGYAVLALACDLPFAGEALLRHVAAIARDGLAARSGEASAWVPELGGRLQPLCAVYSPGCREAAEAALAEGSGSVHSLLASLSVVRVRLTPSLPFFRPELLLNVNRPRDLALARAALASETVEAL